jgi:hypothetical protein
MQGNDTRIRPMCNAKHQEKKAIREALIAAKQAGDQKAVEEVCHLPLPIPLPISLFSFALYLFMLVVLKTATIATSTCCKSNGSGICDCGHS